MKLSLLLFSASLPPLTLLLAFFLYETHTNMRSENPHYNLTTLSYTTVSKDLLPPTYLQELLDFDVASTHNLYAIDLRSIQKKLMSAPCIETASCKRNPPHTLHIDYTLKTPIAYLSDFAYMACDPRGCVFCTKGIYTPKHLPRIYLGLDTAPTHIPQDDLEIFLLASQTLPNLEYINLSRQHQNLAYRMILLKTSTTLWIVDPKHFEKTLEEIIYLLDDTRVEDRVVDLRIPNKAYVYPDTLAPPTYENLVHQTHIF